MQTRSMRKSKEGFVISSKMDKSVVVGVEQRFRHPLYKKIVTKLKKIVAHDEENKCRVGDKVLIDETRPISKTKRWRVEKIIGQKRMEGSNDTSTN